MSMPFLEQMDPSPLTFLCAIHHVTLSTISEQNDKQLIGEQYTIEVYVTTSESLLLQCFPISLSQTPPTPSDRRQAFPEMTITIASQSKASLIQPHILTVPHDDGGLWSLDCSATDPQEFSTLQDMMTYFIKFENQRQMRNTLAMVNPSSYQVTHVIAENVYLDRNNNNGGADNGALDQNEDNDDEANSVLADDDFIATRENYYGQKLPVTMDDSVFKGGLELRKVRLIYQTSHCIDVGSDWLARGLINAGDSLADYIHSGSSSVEGRVGKTANTELMLSSKERQYFDMAYNFTSMAGNMAGQWFSKLVNLAALKQATSDFHLPTPQTHLGNSAFQAATRVVEGSVVAAGTVFSASRQGLIQVIEKKYGPDAGYMAEKLMGSDKTGEDVMVYFDGQGISRKVVVQQQHQQQQQGSTSTNQQASTSVLVYQDNENEREDDDHRQLVYDIDELGYSTEEKKTGRFVMV